MADKQVSSNINPFHSILRLGLRIQHINQKLEQDSGMTLTQWSLLKCLVDNPTMSALNLAQSLGIQPSTLTQSLKRLERKGLIIVTKDPLDARRKLLSVTRSGNLALRETDLKIADWHKSINVSAFSVQTLFKGLEPIL